MSLVTITDKQGARWFAWPIKFRGVNFLTRELLARPIEYMRKVLRVDWITEPLEDDEQTMGDTER